MRLPSERELTEALAVSRTTVTRAYALLRESGYAVSRQGSGTFTRVPGGRARSHDRALLPGVDDGDAIDLNCAAAPAPAGLMQAFADAIGDLPAHLGGHGYFPAGLPLLQQRIAASYAARGLPTDPDQVLVTPGALAARPVVRRPSPAAATGCWSSRRSTPTPPRRCATPARGWCRRRSTRRAGTSTRWARRCAARDRGWPTWCRTSRTRPGT